MKDRLRASWKLEGDFDIIDVSNGFFLVNFDLNADKEKIMHGGPWMIFDHYLTVRQWDPEFSALESKVDKTLVWVRFPGLGMVYYNESVLLTIAAANGRPIKVDLNTLNMNRGRFARVCVEIDLNSPVVGKFCLNDRWHKVEYEGLHLLCTGCGCYGHLIRECPKTVFESTKKHEDGFENTQKEEEIHKASNQIETQPISKTEGNSKAQSSIPIDVHGEWMIVTRKKRNTPQERKILGQGKIHKGSSFGNPSKNGIISDKEKEKNLQFKDLTTQEDFTTLEVKMFSQAITFKVSSKASHWICTAIYANPHRHIRQALWDHLDSVREEVSLPWLVLGDFNEVTCASEVQGGHFSPAKATRFNETIDKCKLLDLENWVRFGDRNTKFFHTQTLVCRKRNKIHGLFLDDGTWSTDQEVLRFEARRYFLSLFSNENMSNSHTFHNKIIPQLRQDEANLLMAPVTMEEVHSTILGMKSMKSPGPDGFQPFFYKKYWPIVGKDLYIMVQNAFRYGFADSNLLDTLIVLIPKVDHPSNLKEFRPISLCNVAYKVIMKVLVKRIRPFISNLIGPFQSSFIPGRGTTDNVIMANHSPTKAR
uniref:Transposon TX1 uncharacterized n=1 Tax=Cajanus cajan TaxID=3821 RepID=A0A151S8U7_CAJCA|nr:Transposon TX1 uncharacterized [Cajanus cajan]